MINKDEKNSKKSFKYKEIKTDYETLGKVISSPNKKKIIFSLTMPKTISEIAKTTNIDISNVSRNIKDLEKLNLISIKNKDSKKGKIIVLTKKGLTLVYDLIN